MGEKKKMMDPQVRAIANMFAVDAERLDKAVEKFEVEEYWRSLSRCGSDRRRR